MSDELVKLLYHIDGHLGLAIYRDDHSDEWKNEAKLLRLRLYNAIEDMEAKAPVVKSQGRIAPPVPTRPNPGVPERRDRRCSCGDIAYHPAGCGPSGCLNRAA